MQSMSVRVSWSEYLVMRDMLKFWRLTSAEVDFFSSVKTEASVAICYLYTVVCVYCRVTLY